LKYQIGYNISRNTLGKDFLYFSFGIPLLQHQWHDDIYWAPRALGSHFWEEYIDSELKSSGSDSTVYLERHAVDEVYPIDTALPEKAGFWFGIAWPVLMNALIRRYNVRKYDPVDLCSLGSGAVSTLFIDNIHPLVYPLRLFAVPIATEALLDRKWKRRAAKRD
jgi:hypothetical protein